MFSGSANIIKRRIEAAQFLSGYLDNFQLHFPEDFFHYQSLFTQPELAQAWSVWKSMASPTQMFTPPKP